MFIYNEDNKNDHEDVEMVEEEENENNYKMKKHSNVYKTLSSAKKGAIIQSLDDDHKFNLLNTIFAGNLNKAISENVAKAVKSNSMDIHITGPFLNKKTGKSHWVMVYGDFRQAYMLKAHFTRVYLETLFKEREKVMKSNVDINHCKSYYEIGICMEEYGEENLWKHCVSKDASKTGPPVKRVSCVYSCDTNDFKKEKTGLKDDIDFFFMVVKKHNMNPIGPLLLDFLNDSSLGIYKNLMKDRKHEDLVAGNITNNIDQRFSWSYTLCWNDSLNHWLVNCDII
jgi:hypothetical protein